MKTTRCIALLVAALSNVLVAGCDDAVRAPVTIVVDTDSARAKEDASQLNALRQGVQSDRAQLDKARVELLAVRESLKTASTLEQKATLEQKLVELERQVVAENAVTKDELDAQLRAQEERLKAFISAEVRGAPPAPAPATTTTPATTPATSTTTTTGPTLAQAKALVQEGRARLQAQNVEAADVDGAVALVVGVDAAVAKGDAASAVAGARAFADKAAAVVVDRVFCRRKYERVNTLSKQQKLAPDVEQKVAAALAAARAKTAAGEFVAANAALNDALAALR